MAPRRRVLPAGAVLGVERAVRVVQPQLGQRAEKPPAQGVVRQHTGGQNRGQSATALPGVPSTTPAATAVAKATGRPLAHDPSNHFLNNIWSSRSIRTTSPLLRSS